MQPSRRRLELELAAARSAVEALEASGLPRKLKEPALDRARRAHVAALRRFVSMGPPKPGRPVAASGAVSEGGVD